jgi:predicted nucleic acid-binding protein
VYATNPSLGFEDALAAAYVEIEALDGIYSYDRGFDRIAGVKRFEPAPAATPEAPR